MPDTPKQAAIPSPIEPPHRGRWLWYAAALVLVVSVASAWYYHAHKASAATAAGEDQRPTFASGPDDAVPVETVRLSQGGIQRTSTQIGSVHPFEEADIYAKVSGYLAELYVDFGDRVKQGQLLAVIDDPEIIKEAERAAADVLQAKAAVAQAEAIIQTTKADREAAATAVQQAEAEVDRYVASRVYHSKKLARYTELVKKSAIPQEIADEEEDAYGSARASELSSRKAVLNAKAQLSAAIARVGKAEADLAEATANVKVSEAKKATADVLAAYTKITSPYTGVITKRTYLRGAFIRSASEGGNLPLLNVARTDKVRVITQVPDVAVPYLDVGDPAEVTLDALPGEVFRGKVSRFADAEDPTSRTMHTEIDLPNPKNRLRPGMYGIAKIVLDTASKHATLPASCLVGESKGGQGDVYVIKDGKANKTRVEVGLDDGLRVEILKGLTPEDEVIMNTGSVTEGAPVRPSPKVTDGGRGSAAGHG
jgi:RND family efflux transporter MFP subunit